MALNLVSYSDTSDEEADTQNRVPKLQSKLPNPFGKPNEANSQLDDNKDEHNGRTRNFPSERGNWVTYVYVQYPSTELVSKLQKEIMSVLKSTITLESTEFHNIDDLHLSLTRTVVLRHHWINEFVQSVEQTLQNINSFWIDLNSIEVYCNDNRTRTFLSLSFGGANTRAEHNLQNIVRRLDSCLEEFKLPPFYKEASFHVSLLWCLGDKRNELRLLLPIFRDILERISVEDNSNFALNIDKLYCKIGNKLYSFKL